MATAHAKSRPPSAAKRWIGSACPASAEIVALYPNTETEASSKGDLWHVLMEDRIVFGTLPLTCDPDAAEAMEDLAKYIDKRLDDCIDDIRGETLKIYVEQQLDIPETGEFGTADVIIVATLLIEIIDEKSGYVPVDVKYNAQMMVYLLGAIAKYGPRHTYRLTVHQPNFDHIDGPLRFWEPTDEDIHSFRANVLDSVANADRLLAGPWCKATYCPHRGACSAFASYVRDDLALGWHTSELKSMDDASLSKALDASDELAGWRTELRSEAMRRIMNMDRKIDGYKVVKGRRSRAVRDPNGLVNSILTALGLEWGRKLFPDLAWVSNLDVEHEEVLKHLGSPKHIEDVLKQYARVHNLPRNGWKMLYDNVVGAYISETASGLTLERAIDGRPAHKRGSEFSTISPVSTQIVL